MLVQLENIGRNAVAGEQGAWTVSVIIPAYQAVRYISTALASVFAQTFTDYEVIVINDGSPDTAELERLLESYRAPIFYLSQSNKGPSAARNRGLAVARGRFVAFLDADDYWEPTYLAKQVSFIHHHPALDLVYTDAMLTGESPLAGRTFMETTPSEGRVTLEALLSERCTIILSGVLARRQSIIKAGMFDEKLKRSEDYDLWLRMARFGALIAFQRKVLVYRVERTDALSADTARLFESALVVLDRTERSDGLSSAEREALVRRRAKLRAYMQLERGKRELCSGRFAAARAALEEANQFFKSRKIRLVLVWLKVWPNLVLRLYNALRPGTAELRES